MVQPDTATVPSLSNLLLGLNTITSMAIVWGGGRLLGKIEKELQRTVDLVDKIEERVGHLEGRGRILS